MKKIILISLAFSLLTSCLKTDIFDKELEDHFQYSDFYLNDFEKFSMDLVSLSTYSAQIPTTGVRHFGEAHYQMNQAYFDLLMKSFDGKVTINDKVITPDSNFVFIQNYGPFANSTTLKPNFELVLTDIKVMGRINFNSISVTIP